MSKYKTGDKVVLEIIQDNHYGYYKVGNETHSWWNSHELLDNGSVPLSKYIKSMEEKLHNQRVEINRLLKENKELKITANWRDNCAKASSVYEARVAGQEAWELAKKIELAIISGGYSNNELKEIFGTICLDEIFDLTYAEAAAKVAEWEKTQEEICVGDVFLSNRTGTKCIVTHINNETVTTLWDDNFYGNRSKNYIREGFKKIGHIDVASMLAQIGGEE